MDEIKYYVANVHKLGDWQSVPQEIRHGWEHAIWTKIGDEIYPHIEVFSTSLTGESWRPDKGLFIGDGFNKFLFMCLFEEYNHYAGNIVIDD